MASTTRFVQLLTIMEIPLWMMCFLFIVDPFDKTEVIIAKIGDSECGKKLAEIPFSIIVLAYDVDFIFFATFMQKVPLNFWRLKKESTGPFLFALNAIISCVSTYMKFRFSFQTHLPS